ncbi:MAG TPA: porin family protein [Albidovulum sp.]|uniref:outer membrane protein n=1 Tax=Albidovulum sp. TaxID=1872424 RepID=UPI002B6F6527|nr:porin family protein [Albidovulum sp.]
MKSYKQILLGTAFGAALAAPAFAGGLNTPVTEPAPLAPVVQVAPSHDWTGGYIGAQIGNADGDYGALGDNNVSYGVRGGYDWDFGNWVVGAGLDWDKTDVDLGGGTSIDSIARLKFRGGYDFGRTLVYATAGGARAEADIAGVSRSDNGWFAGLGAEYAINDQWSVNGEVLKNQFDDFDNLGTDLEATTATVGVAFRF